MNKNKKTITILIITIILLSLVICYLLFKVNKLKASDSNNQNKTTTKEILTSKKSDENLASCDTNEDVECIYYNKNGFNVVSSKLQRGKIIFY